MAEKNSFSLPGHTAAFYAAMRVDVDYLCLEYLLLLSGYDVSAAAARATPHPGHDSRPHVTFSVSDRRKIGLAAKRER
ncbi:hypothetical protein VTN96DRAFT_5329 [Rasamsonia emersonii]